MVGMHSSCNRVKPMQRFLFDHFQPRPNDYRPSVIFVSSYPPRSRNRLGRSHQDRNPVIFVFLLFLTLEINLLTNYMTTYLQTRACHNIKLSLSPEHETHISHDTMTTYTSEIKQCMQYNLTHAMNLCPHTNVQNDAKQNLSWRSI